MNKSKTYNMLLIMFASTLFFAGCGSTEEEESGDNVIYFDFDKSNIKPDFAKVIDKYAEKIKSDEKQKWIIEGHCDSRGPASYNLALGNRRAESIKKMLSKKLNAKSLANISHKSYGEMKPAVQNAKSSADHAKNRRGVIIKAQ